MSGRIPAAQGVRGRAQAELARRHALLVHNRHLAQGIGQAPDHRQQVYFSQFEASLASLTHKPAPPSPPEPDKESAPAAPSPLEGT